MVKRETNVKLPNWVSEYVNGRFFWDVLKTFIGVFLAFSLGQWEQEQRLHKSENTVLTEISSELTADIEDLQSNINGHKSGIAACRFFKRHLIGELSGPDTMQFYFNNLLREFISVQHSAAYESLQSRGLEIIKDDSLRLQIVNVYDFQYEIVFKLEEKYEPHEFFKLYYHPMVNILAPCIDVANDGKWTLKRPLSTLPETEKTKMRMWVSRLYGDRIFLVEEFERIKQELVLLKGHIDREVKI